MLVNASSLIGAGKFCQRVDLLLPILTMNRDLFRRNRCYLTVTSGNNHLSAIVGCLPLHPGADEGSLRAEQGHRLTLHVGTHQSTIGIVVLKEGDQGGGDAHYLLRGNIHELRLLRRFLDEPAPYPHIYLVADKLIPLVEGFAGLGDGIWLLFIRR